MTAGVVIRPGRDDDAEGFIALIGACWAEYPGCVLDVDGEVPELRALAAHYAAAGGALWVAEQTGRVAGMAATKPAGDRAWEICKVYLDATLRGTSLAHDLLEMAEDHARQAGAERFFLWTDTRFTRAHAFYARRSYVRCGPIRALNDLSNSLEYRYAKPARGIAVQALDAAGAATAERRLAAIVTACVGAGDANPLSVPIEASLVEAYWRSVSGLVAQGSRLLLAAWDDGDLVGSVQLDVGTPEYERHRAEVIALFVDPAAQGAPVMNALLRHAETSARLAGRRLLTLGVRAGSASEDACRADGYREGGRIPGYERSAQGGPEDRITFWKAIA